MVFVTAVEAPTWDGGWSQPEHLKAWVLKAHLEKEGEKKGRARLGLERDKGDRRLGRAGRAVENLTLASGAASGKWTTSPFSTGLPTHTARLPGLPSARSSLPPSGHPSTGGAPA